MSRATNRQQQSTVGQVANSCQPADQLPIGPSGRSPDTLGRESGGRVSTPEPPCASYRTPTVKEGISAGSAV